VIDFTTGLVSYTGPEKPPPPLVKREDEEEKQIEMNDLGSTRRVVLRT
jgi:hypothetical protein